MAYNFQNITVLIVEDNDLMLQLLRSIMQTFGVGNIVTALNGEDGFEMFCRNNPDLVITDWMMRPCDGITLSRMIRNEPKSPNQHAPIILTTSFSEKSRIINARDSGITEFLVKPFNTRDLYRRIQQVIEKPRIFVRSESFFGPDRRRKIPRNYEGPLRRENDTAELQKTEKSTEPVTEVVFR